jgi:hypothetical protein
MARQIGNIEKRRVSRLHGVFPLRVRGVDAAGRAFDAKSIADNICADGLYFQLPRSKAWGGQLFAIVQITGSLSIAARGHVLRRETKDYGLSGIAVRFTRARLLAVQEAW